MKRKFILFAAIILALSISIANAQTVWDKQTYNQPDSADLLPNSGRIILNGRLLEPPYDIVVKNDTLFINDLPLRFITKQGPTTRSSNTKSSYGIYNSAQDTFEAAYNHVGRDSAIMLTYHYLNGFDRDVIDSTFFFKNAGGDSSLFVKFHDVNIPLGFLFEPPWPDNLKLKSEAFQDSGLYREAEMLRKAEGNGNLVIVGDRGATIYLKYAQKRIKMINQILSSANLDYEEKINALREIGADRYHAGQILDNWYQ